MYRVWAGLFAIAMTAGAQTRVPASAEAGGANLPAQRIGANDLVAVSVYDAPEFSRSVRVSPDGTIRLPMMKRRVKAVGLLPSELEATLGEALRAEQLLVEPVVTVTMAEYHSRPISVMGAVRRPITFQAAGGVTLLDALAAPKGSAPTPGRRSCSAGASRARETHRRRWCSASRSRS